MENQKETHVESSNPLQIPNAKNFLTIAGNIINSKRLKKGQIVREQLDKIDSYIAFLVEGKEQTIDAPITSNEECEQVLEEIKSSSNKFSFLFKEKYLTEIDARNKALEEAIKSKEEAVNKSISESQITEVANALDIDNSLTKEQIAEVTSNLTTEKEDENKAINVPISAEPQVNRPLDFSEFKEKLNKKLEEEAKPSQERFQNNEVIPNSTLEPNNEVINAPIPNEPQVTYPSDTNKTDAEKIKELEEQIKKLQEALQKEEIQNVDSKENEEVISKEEAPKVDPKENAKQVIKETEEALKEARNQLSFEQGKNPSQKHYETDEEKRLLKEIDELLREQEHAKSILETKKESKVQPYIDNTDKFVTKEFTKSETPKNTIDWVHKAMIEPNPELASRYWIKAAESCKDEAYREVLYQNAADTLGSLGKSNEIYRKR